MRNNVLLVTVRDRFIVKSPGRITAGWLAGENIGNQRTMVFISIVVARAIILDEGGRQCV
jgi:hypothetical protein